MDKFNNHFLDCIVFGCITNADFLRQIRQHFPIEAFRSPVRKKVARLLFDYFDDYREAPGEHFYDLFDEFIETISGKNQELYIKYIGTIKDIDEVNEEYLLDKIFEAARHIRIEESVIAAAKLVKDKDYDQAQSVILDAFKDPQTSVFQYTDYFEHRDDIISRHSEEPFLMKTLIPSMDRIIGGIRRKEVVVWLGTPKAGKTYGLINMAHAALLQGLVVVFVSLELHRHRITGRMDQAIAFLSGSKEDTSEVMAYERGKWRKIRKRVKTIYDVEEVDRGRNILQKYGGKLIVASAPPNTKNYRDIELFLDELQIYQKIIPDVICVDYLRNMKATAPGQSRKEMIGGNCQGLVKIAAERNCVVHTAQQGNRKAMSSAVLKPDMIADDIDPIGYVDLVPAICQTDEEERRNEARIYLAIVREGAKGAQIKVKRDLARGQFWLEDWIYEWEEGKK